MTYTTSASRQAIARKGILIVDDEVGILRICSDYLTRHGYEVLTATNGMEALKLMSMGNDKVRVAVLDLMMPYMDGQSLMVELRRFYPDLKCIASSGLFAEDDHQMIAELKQQGFDGVLAKPFSCETLRSMVEGQILTKPDIRLASSI